MQAVQTAEGQLLAVELAIAQTPPGAMISKQVFGELCAMSGLWILIRERVLPELAIGSDQVEQMAGERDAAEGAWSEERRLLVEENRQLKAGTFLRWLASGASLALAVVRLQCH